MLRKVTIPVVAVMLLLVVAPLVLAQEDAGQTPPPPQESQTTALDPAQEQGATPSAEGTQSSLPALRSVEHFNDNNNLVIDCERAKQIVAQQDQLGETSDPEVQSSLAHVQDLDRICTESGFTPTSAEEPTTPTPATDGESATPTDESV